MIVYSNSCSFGATQKHKVYANTVAENFSAQLINQGQNGSCNRRIIRTTLRDLVDLKAKDNVLLLLGLTFISRTEIWRPDLAPVQTDGHFHSITVQHQKFNWAVKGLIDTVIPNIHEYADSTVKSYYREWLTHYSPEAEITNLLTDIVMLTGWCKNSNIPYVVFSNVDCLPSDDKVGYTSPFLQSLRHTIEADPNVLNPWIFSFGSHALSLGYVPKDQNLYGRHGHPGLEAHAMFGNLLTNHITKNYNL
jgi:hypothetical protein